MASPNEHDGDWAPASQQTISYAQNAEDIVLARGLTSPQGFYVDIGAYDPDHESVTKLFYERGWRGINVEPIAAFVDRFSVDRARDINICAAICATDGEKDLWVSPANVPGHSTLDRGIAESHTTASFVPRSVPALRLDTLFEKFLPPGQVVDFLKVDVEGAEQEVLASWDPSRVQPRVILVEAMAPHLAKSTHDLWESIVLDAGYRMTLFDGLNRYYVRNDETDLAERLSIPANILDDYETIGYHRLRTYAEEIEVELGQWKSWATALRARTSWLEDKIAALARAK